MQTTDDQAGATPQAAAPTEPALSVGCVILTMGDRSEDLQRAVASVASQRDVQVDCLIVVNDAAPIESPPDARVLAAGRNLGIPEGRNVGARQVAGDLVAFLDDDAWIVGDDMFARAAARFAAEPDLGIVSLRIIDPGGRPTARRHVPRLRVGDPAVGSEVTTFLGGACIVRRAVFDQVGWLPGDFVYAHEETSLAWRALDAGWRIRYAGDLAIHHPATPPGRHARYHHLTARNRVLLARRHLPWAVATAYLSLWTAVTLLRAGRDGVGPSLRGFVDGFRHPRGERRPISWRTVARMTRLGRPPIL
ncbi:MAG TPA: glycosyltransferase [Euzebyales bacterium]